MSPEDLATSIRIASEQIQAGRGPYALPVEAMQLIYPVKQGEPVRDGSVSAISANRWYSLAAKGGHEDYFSSDLTDEEMKDAFKALRQSEKNILFAFGEKDGSVPESMDKEKLLEKFKRCAGEKAETLLLKDANHQIHAQAPQKEFIDRVIGLVTSLSR